MSEQYASSFDLSAELEALDNGKSYGGSRNLFRIAAQSFGVELSREEDEEWRAVLNAAILVDHFADIEQRETSLSEPFKDIENGQFIDGINSELQLRTYQYMKEIDQTKRELLYERIDKVQQLVESQRKSDSVSELVDIRLEEGMILADLLKLPVSNDSEDVDARNKFNAWIEKWSRTGYMIDSLIDIADDYKNNETRVQPKLGVRLKLGAAATREAMHAIRLTPPRLLARCALNGFRYVIAQQKVQSQEVEPDRYHELIGAVSSSAIDPKENGVSRAALFVD